jgi:hypothetical protein
MSVWADAPRLPALSGVTRTRFEQEIVPAGRPALLKGLVRDWPIVEAAARSRQALTEALLAEANREGIRAWFAQPDQSGRFTYSDDLTGFNHERRIVTLADLIAYLIDHADDPAAHTAYAGGIPIPKIMPGLLPQLPMPLLEPGREMLVSLWLGGRSRTAAHWDVPQNLACVIAGRRRFTLFPTDQVANLYVGPLDFTLAGQPTSLVDIVEPDLERFPKFRAAMAAALVADLEPGDALYLPSLWWHHVEALDPFGAMVNFWWRDGPDWLMTPLFTLFHSLLTIRDLPPAERTAWRVFFDHYIFQTGDDPWAHLPESVRGMFGELTQEKRSQLKSMLAAPLR